MRFKEFGRGLGEWFGVPAKEKAPHKANISKQRSSISQDRAQRKPVENPNLAEKKGEGFKAFYLHAKEKYKEDGKRFDYAGALLEGLKDQRKQELIREYGEGEVGRKKRQLQETDSGIAMQMGKYAAIGASMVFAAFYLRGDTAFIGSTALAAGGAMLYGRETLRGILSFGEKRMRSLAYGATNALKVELRNIPQEERGRMSREKFRELKKLYEGMIEKKDQYKKRKMQDALALFGFPKMAVAAMIACGMPVSLGAQDLDLLKIPDMKEAHLLLTQGLSGDISYMVDTMKGVGSKIGGPIWEQSGIGRKLAIGSVTYGTLLGFFGGTIARTNFEIAKSGIVGLEKLLARRPTLKDIDEIKVRTVSEATKKARAKKQSSADIPQPQSTASEDVAKAVIEHLMKQAGVETRSQRIKSSSKAAKVREEEPPAFRDVVQEARKWGYGSSEGEELLRGLQEREEEEKFDTRAQDRWETESPEFRKEKEKAQVKEGETTALLSLPFGKPTPQIPQTTGIRESTTPEPTPISWRAKPESVRATILGNFGIAVEEGKGVAYQQFKDQLKGFVSLADRPHLEELQNFLTTHDHQLNGAKGQKPVLMWVDRRQLLKFIDARLYELSIAVSPGEPTAFPEAPFTIPPPSPESPAAQEEEPAFTLEDLLEEADRKEKEKEEKEKNRKTRTVPEQAQKMLTAILTRQVNPHTLAKGRNMVAQEIDKIKNWDTRKVAGRLLKEIHSLVSGVDTRDKILDPREVLSYQKILRDLDTEKKGSMVQKGLVIVRSDDEGWIYRGSVMAPLDPSGITLRARLNITLNEDSIKALDSLAARSAFFYRIGKPGSQNDPARMNATVTVYFPGDKPRRDVLEKLGLITEKFQRGIGQDLAGNKYNNHLYLSEGFVDRLDKEQEDRLMRILEKADPHIFQTAKEFLLSKAGISETEFHAIKKTLHAFGFPIEYDKERGIVFLTQQKQESVA